MNHWYSATVGKTRLNIHHRDEFMAEVMKFGEGAQVQIGVRKFKHTRSLNQNAYYFGVVVKMIADEAGYDTDDVHVLMKNEFGMRKPVEARAGFHKWWKQEIIRSTTTYSTSEMTEYIERVRQWAAEFLGLNIPDPNETQI